MAAGTSVAVESVAVVPLRRVPFREDVLPHVPLDPSFWEPAQTPNSSRAAAYAPIAGDAEVPLLVLMTLRAEGVGRAGRGLLPPSLRGLVPDGGPTNASLEWRLCGGRWKPEWQAAAPAEMRAFVASSPIGPRPSASGSNVVPGEQVEPGPAAPHAQWFEGARDAVDGAAVPAWVVSAVHAHTHHGTCGLMDVSQCGPAASFHARRARSLRQLGALLGTSAGLGGAVVEAAAGGSLRRTGPSSDALADHDHHPRERNALIAAHKRPIMTNTETPATLNTSSTMCALDRSLHERLCTNSLVPTVGLWEYLRTSKMSETTTRTRDGTNTEPVWIQRRLRRHRDTALSILGKAVPRRKAGRAAGLDELVGAASLLATVPSVAFVLGTGYHSAQVSVAVDTFIPPSGDPQQQHTVTRAEIELAFVVSRRAEVATLLNHLGGPLAAALEADTKVLQGRGGGDTTTPTDLLAAERAQLIDSVGRSASLHAAVAEAHTRQLTFAAQHSVDSTRSHCSIRSRAGQKGELEGHLDVAVDCAVNGGGDSSGGVVEAEVLLVLPTHVVNPLFSQLVASSGAPNSGPVAVNLDGCPDSGPGEGGVVRINTTAICLKELVYQPYATTIRAVLRLVLAVPGTNHNMDNKNGSSAHVHLSLPLRFPSMRLEQYPPDMNRMYTLPAPVLRHRVLALRGSAPATTVPPRCLHHHATMSALFGDGTDSADDSDRMILSSVVPSAWAYVLPQSSASGVPVVRLPVPDPAMIFNVLALSFGLVSVAASRVLALAIRGDMLYLPAIGKAPKV